MIRRDPAPFSRALLQVVLLLGLLCCVRHVELIKDMERMH